MDDDIKIYSCAADDRFTVVRCKCGQRFGYYQRDGWGYFADNKPVCSWACERKYDHHRTKKDCGEDYTMTDAYYLWSKAGITNPSDALERIIDEYGRSWLDRTADYVGWHPETPGADSDTLLALITPSKLRSEVQHMLTENYRQQRRYIENHSRTRQTATAIG